MRKIFKTVSVIILGLGVFGKIGKKDLGESNIDKLPHFPV